MAAKQTHQNAGGAIHPAKHDPNAIHSSKHDPSAIHSSKHVPSAKHQSYHVPVMRNLDNGAVVPADTPSVVAAKQTHKNAGGAIHPAKHDPNAIHSSKHDPNAIHSSKPVPSAKHQSYHVPVMQTLDNGAIVPADTPSVVAAKQSHQNAGGAIHPAKHDPNAVQSPKQAPSPKHQSYHVPVLQTLDNGAVVPADTPSVMAAKQTHQNAGGAIHPAKHDPNAIQTSNNVQIPKYQSQYDTPAVAAAKRANQNGGGAINPFSNVPDNTPAIDAAKRTYQNAIGAINPSNNVPAANYQSQPVSTLHTLSNNGPLFPAETPVVAAAKQTHYNAGGALHNSFTAFKQALSVQ